MIAPYKIKLYILKYLLRKTNQMAPNNIIFLQSNKFKSYLQKNIILLIEYTVSNNYIKATIYSICNFSINIMWIIYNFTLSHATDFNAIT